MKSKDISIIIIGALISIIIIGALISIIGSFIITNINLVKLDSELLILILIGVLYLSIGIIAFYLTIRIKESEDRLDKQEIEQNKINEKLKLNQLLESHKKEIYKELINIKTEIEILKNNGKKNRRK